MLRALTRPQYLWELKSTTCALPSLCLRLKLCLVSEKEIIFGRYLQQYNSAIVWAIYGGIVVVRDVIGSDILVFRAMFIDRTLQFRMMECCRYMFEFYFSKHLFLYSNNFNGSFKLFISQIQLFPKLKVIFAKHLWNTIWLYRS